ncbi:helix-turn-helix domain-containing protein [Serratia fonticola]
MSVYDEHNDVLLYNVSSHFILGLEQLFLSDKQQSIKFESDANVWVISKEEAVALFDSCTVWREISILLAYVSAIFFSRYALSASCDVYVIIKSHLEFIWRLPEQQRKKVSVIDFILKRNKISRSSVYRIIRDLNDGGYIKTVKGKLHHISRIPQKY